jgi:hypothetical protein
MERRIERSFLHFEQPSGHRSNVKRDSESVVGPAIEGFENEQFQRAWKAIRFSHSPLVS